MNEKIKEENEKKKEYLKSYLPTMKAVKRIEEDIEEVRQAKMHPSFFYDNMPRGNEKHDLSDYIVTLDNLIDKLIKAKYKRVKVYTDLYSNIELIENEIEKEVLKLHYLKGLKWEDVCEELGYSWSQIHRIHTDALTKFKMT